MRSDVRNLPGAAESVGQLAMTQSANGLTLSMILDGNSTVLAKVSSADGTVISVYQPVKPAA